MRKVARSLTSLAILAVATTSANAEIAWQKNLRAAHTQAQADGKLLLLHFYSDNCGWCEKLEKGSFKNPQVDKAIAENFVPVKVHANSSPKLAAMFKVTKFPTDVVVSTDGKTLSHTVSPQEPTRYVAMLSKTLPALNATKVAAVAKTAATPKPSTPVSAVATKQSVPSYASAGQQAVAAPNLPAEKKTPASTVSAKLPEPSQFAMPALDGSDSSKVSSDAVAQTNQFAVKATETPATESSATSLTAPGLTAPTQTAKTIEPAVAAPKPEEVAETKAVAESASQQIGEVQEEAELAMQGFCPVTVINEDSWVQGKPEFGVIHLGKLYLFSSDEKMTAFLADPIPYTPVLNEIDVVRFFEERKIVPGKREWGLKDPIHNRMFFFADEAAMNHFYNEYERYSDAAIEVMDAAVKESNPGT